mmetsp:Transcript_68064/g.134257  ORF Transcript_68064/g.134257 Transcript_68064/m.134257 type:complete len:137 (-) Transcript_68064:147-557(-)
MGHMRGQTAMRSGVLRRTICSICVVVILHSLSSGKAAFVSRAITTRAAVHPVLAASAEAEQDAPSKTELTQERGFSYYAGMLTSPLKEEDLERDMVTPTLKFAGGSAVLALLLFSVFLAANGGLGADPKAQPLPGF